MRMRLVKLARMILQSLLALSLVSSASAQKYGSRKTLLICKSALPAHQNIDGSKRPDEPSAH